MVIIVPETFVHGNQHADVQYVLKRDPDEPDDTHCVRVLSPDDGALVGNICRGYAKHLASIMDNNPRMQYFAIREGRRPSNIYKIRVKVIQE